MTIFKRSGRGGRRRDDEGVESLVFELDAVEFVQASDDLGLLRVVGRWVAPIDMPLGDIVLNAVRGTETIELKRLPDLSGVAPLASPHGEEWRGAFTVPVDIALDPRLELVLVAGDDAEVALPRPGEATPADDAVDADPESPVVADLVAQLDEVVRLDEEELALPASLEESPDTAPELAELRAELELRVAELEDLRTELAAETRRREALEQELRDRDSVEDDLRNAMAMQEAELASAVAEASQRVRQEQRRRDLVPTAAGGDDSGVRPADEAFLTRLERARRAAEAAPSG